VDSTLRIWNTVTFEHVMTIRGHKHEVTTVVLSPDGRRIISGSVDCFIRAWDAESLALVAELTRSISVFGARDFSLWQVTGLDLDRRCSANMSFGDSRRDCPAERPLSSDVVCGLGA
jgi:WD40 repeat protein